MTALTTWGPIFPTALLVVVWVAWMLRARLSQRGRLALRVGVVLCAVSGLAAYFEFGELRHGHFMNAHDVYHYYVGPKYAEEHRYLDLYRVTVLAQEDTPGASAPQTYRNLDTYEVEHKGDLLPLRDALRARFTDARWEELKADVAFFAERLPRAAWAGTLKDKGYNATPVWNRAGRAVTAWVPLDASWSVPVLTGIDLVFIGIIGAVVWAALGWEAGLLMIAFIGLNVFGSTRHIKGCFLRLDWLAAAVGAVLALRAKRGALAGVLVAWAAMSRVFPLMLALGPAVIAAEQLVRRRTLAPELRRFFMGFGIAIVVLFLVTLPGDGLRAWEAFAAKIAVHTTGRAAIRIGMLYALVDSENIPETHAAATALKPWILLPALGLFAASVRRLPPAGALAWGVIPVFFTTETTFYYYVMLAIPMTWLLTRDGTARNDRAHAVTAAAMLLVSVYGYFRLTALPIALAYIQELSWALLGAYCIVALAGLPGPQGSASMLDFVVGIVDRHRRRTAGASAALAVTVGLVVFGPGLWVDLHRPLATLRANDSERELVFVGEVMMARDVAASLERQQHSPRFLFNPTATYIQDADIAFANLDSAVSDRGEPLDKPYAYRAAPAVAPALAWAGFDVVSLANAHTLDYGPLALADTEHLLNTADIRSVGLTDADAPQVPQIIDLDGIKVGYLAYCDPIPKYACDDAFDAFERRPAKVSQPIAARDIAALKAQVDVVVVSMHWGLDGPTEPGLRQRTLGQFLISQGADIVAGHHPHNQQDAEWVGDGLILYSLGNFVFDQSSKEQRQSRLYRVVVGKNGVRRAGYLPLTIKARTWQPQPTGEDWMPVPSVRRLIQNALDLW